MIQLRNYQSKAVDKLLDETYDLLARDQRRQKLVLKAPTGAGKTVVMAEFLSRLAEELPDRAELPVRQLAFIWIAPGHLHLQSYGALRQYFQDTRAIHPVQFDDLTENHLRPNELLFLNWQSISSDKNLLVKDNEQQRNLRSLIAQTRLTGTEVVVILDEAHLFASKGDKAQKVLNQLQAVVEVDVSATPLYKSDAQVIIKRGEVVQAEMIKRGVVLNPDLDATLQQGDTLNIVLLKLALKRRQQLADSYRALGKDINPLLLIQLPSDTAKESVLDRTVRDTMLAHLETVEGITKADGRLAVWLAGEKTNLDGIERPNSKVEVLLFKQAIALGWDCPRASVLLIFRELKQESFTIQTVGRILRMPEQQHYRLEELNLGYVYTDLAKDNIKIEPDSADYLSLNKADRRADYAPLLLQAEHVANQRDKRNRLSSQFRRILYEAAEKRWEISRDLRADGETLYAFNEGKLQQRGMETDVDSISIEIPSDVIIHAEVGQTNIDASHRQKFAKTAFERQQLLQHFCRKRCGIYAPADSTPVLRMALLMLLEDYLQWDEIKATKFLLCPQNEIELDALIDTALTDHANYLHQKQGGVRTVETVTWDVPVFEYYNDLYEEYACAPTHILQPSYLRRRPDGNLADSKEEMDFIRFLEEAQHAQHLRWWYKNGAGTRTDFSVAYHRTERGETRLAPFFVDFIIQFANGTLGLFDTKTLDSDPHLRAKHNALHAWIAKRNAQQPGSTVGGVIIRDQKTKLWKYSPDVLPEAYSLAGWEALNPALFAAVPAAV
ncbi:DEAD/DEAH box helicase family protein [Hymenobacter ruricola]|uniref:DEAD/DEAH box helicase family protein n=1 Tax=Hymenobacter ruricola TaxID=2791023 RepID=A0ABS0I6I7_9BACT|nr:DEAD/DEAH box helicase family protein [Hymenobacter ruricola]MBF9222517.1 DEAD/DEAH box helicase family protein [Hymenobacter ruricola]